ncbi:MAG TPA: helix-turn-helix domain-containing protein [Herbaspirillum sp.]|jgi:transcriptional regulator with XRE-family HTH domain
MVIAKVSSRLAVQAAALSTFLLAANHRLSSERVEQICISLALSEDSDFKGKTKQLRSELLKQGIALGHAHALEALAHMAGHTSYMRAREAMKERAGEFAREGFLLRIRVTGSEVPQFAPYSSLPIAGNFIIEQIMALLNIPNEVIFCELRRTPHAVFIEICRASGVWFSIEMLPYLVEDNSLAISEFDAESQRTFLLRMLRALESGRPGTLALYGAIPHTLPPWHYASFNIKFIDTKIRKFLPDERELFFVLDSLGFQSAEIVENEALILGAEGKATLTIAWNRYSGDTPPIEVDMSASILQSLVERYKQWRRGLRMPVNNAVMLVATGATNAIGFHSVDTRFLEDHREKSGLLQKVVADAAGITEQHLQRIEKYGFASEKIIPLLAKALGVDANRLVQKPEGQLGVEISDAQHLLTALSNIHHYGTSFPDDLDSQVEEFIRNASDSLQELGDLVQIQEGVFADVFQMGSVKDEHLVEHAQQLLDSIRERGLILIVARGLAFANEEGALAEMEGMPLHTITFRFQPNATANDIAAWPQTSSN